MANRDTLTLKEIPLNRNYKITKDGKVFKCKNTKKVFELKQRKVKKGLLVSLSDQSKVKTYLVHRLVKITYDYRDDYESLAVKHIDGNLYNNDLSNLEWVTRQDISRGVYKEADNKVEGTPLYISYDDSRIPPYRVRFPTPHGILSVGRYKSAREAVIAARDVAAIYKEKKLVEYYNELLNTEEM